MFVSSRLLNVFKGVRELRYVNIILRQSVLKSGLRNVIPSACNIGQSHLQNPQIMPFRRYSTTPPSSDIKSELTDVEYDQMADNTLELLTEKFEKVADMIAFKGFVWDINYSNGVLTVELGKTFGTYVINRQSPNKQIWLSSPMSGPKRYNFVGGEWVYSRDKISLSSLLKKEFSDMFPEHSGGFDFKIDLQK